MKRKFLLPMLLIMVALFCTACGSSTKELKASEQIEEITVQNFIDQTNAGDDFWLYIGSAGNDACQKNHEDIVAFLEEKGKKLQFLNAQIAEADQESYDALMEGFDFEVNPEASILHISKGYLIKNYDLYDSEAVAQFLTDYAKNNTAADRYITDMTVTELKEKLESGEEFWVYLGRRSCPDCRKYYPRMIEYLKETKEPIYYVVSDKDLLSEEDLAWLSEYRDQNKIEEVPSVLHFDKKEMLKRYDVQKEEDIAAFEEDYYNCCGLLN